MLLAFDRVLYTWLLIICVDYSGVVHMCRLLIMAVYNQVKFSLHTFIEKQQQCCKKN